MQAVCLIRRDPHYRRHAFEAGLQRAGYRLTDAATPRSPADLLVIWNRYGSFADRANGWERAGGTVLVCENGYLGADTLGRQFYAIAAGGHNGSGWHPQEADDRFAQLGVDVAPWRDGGTHVVVRGQRGIGTSLMASPAGWHQRAAAAIRAAQPLPVTVVEHPGRHAPRVPIDVELATAAACVIWASAVGVRALVMGVPVFYAAPHWVGSAGARPLAASPDLANPVRDDGLRLAALRRIAWAQWSVAEIEDGIPFVLFRDRLRAAA